MEKPSKKVFFSASERSRQDEIMDSFDFQGAEMEAVLSDLDTVNNYLGGTNITLNGIDSLLKNRDTNRAYTIVDLGCGDGELLRKCADYGKRKGYKFDLLGIDANEHILVTARQRSTEYQNIRFQKLDVTSSNAIWPEMDMVLCTLFLHHFSSEKIVNLLKKLATHAKVGIVINDLHRNRCAFRLFQLFSAIFLKTNTAKFDGLVSIARGFKRQELESMSNEIHQATSKIRWKWAFRYQWVLSK